MKTLTAMLSLYLAVFLSGCAYTLVEDPAKYSQQLLATLNGNGNYIDRMNEAINAKDYEKAESVSKSWVEQLDKSIGEVAQISLLKEDTGLKDAVKKALEGYKHVAIYEYNRLIDLRRKQVNGDEAYEPQIQAMLNRINTSVEVISSDLVRAVNEFEQKFGNQ